VWFPRDTASLEQRLGARQIAAWAEDGVLHVLWRGEADQARLTGGLNLPLWPVGGAAGLWEASVRVRRLDEAMIAISVAAIGAGDTLLGRPAGAPVVFRGGHAPDLVPDHPLAGELQEHVLESAALGSPRGITVYLPPRADRKGPLPACALADGQSASSFAPVLDAAILNGSTPPVILVGVHNASTRNPGSHRKADLRALEYVPRYRSRRFTAHMSFVTDEVVPWATRRFAASPGLWVAAGYSNGAVWAIAAGQRRPDVFGGVAALSAGIVPNQIARASRQVRHYLAAGTLEPPFRRQTSEWAARLERAGMTATYREWTGGHDSWWWQAQLPTALTWLLADR
jgi:enterochelin esterase-like enzyme